MGGSAAGNYALSSTSTTGSGTISPAVINLSGNRTYDAGVDAGAAIFGSGGTVTGVSAETLTLTGSGALAGKNAGNQSVSSLGTLALGNGTGLASNYTLVGGTDAVAVTPATITVAGATGVNKTYDATTALPSGTISAANAGSGGVPPVAVVPALPLTGLVAGGTGGFTLSGTVLSSSSSANGLPMTITGSLSNGGTTISGTFIVQARAGSGNLPVSDQIAESSTDVVTFVPGTRTAANEVGAPIDDMPYVYSTADDTARSWKAVDTFGSPGFEQAVACVKGLCMTATPAKDRSAAGTLGR